MIILFSKSQLALFDAPVQVGAHVRKDGVVVKPHTRIQKIALHHQAAPRQGSLFDAQPHVAPGHTLDLFANEPEPIVVPKQPEPPKSPTRAAPVQRQRRLRRQPERVLHRPAKVAAAMWTACTRLGVAAGREIRAGAVLLRTGVFLETAPMPA
jgi:hypothetical protein